MDVLRNIKRTAAVTLTLAIASTAGAQGIIGLNFTDLADSTDHVGVAETAGAPGFVQSNWNNLDGNNSAAATSAVDSNGSATSLSVEWTAANTWRSGSDAALSADHTLMKGYLDDGQNAVINISNIPYASYKVVIYSNTDSGNVGSLHTVTNGVRSSYETYAVRQDSFHTDNPFSYVLAENGTTATATAGDHNVDGNYTVVKGVEGSDSVTVMGVRNNSQATPYRGTITAVQIIELIGGEKGLVMGDFNDDGEATVADYDIWRANYGTDGFISAGDANLDSKIDFDDFIVLRTAVLANTGVDIATIPEPASLALLGLGGVALIKRKRA